MLPVIIPARQVADILVTVSSQSAPPESDILEWLAIGRTGSCNGRAVLRALESFGSVGGLFEAGDRELAALGFSRTTVERLRRVDWEVVCRERDSLARSGVSILPIGASGYPEQLAAISSPPPVLYCRGKSGVLKRPQIAIVGSRAATRGGRERARALARELAACGLVITSGLARGIDAAAHRGALDVGAPSVAVVATGPDRIYPHSNAEVARDLLDAGTVVTERTLGTPPLPGNFPRRNRLISGLSLGVLVVEASLRSGSLITARFAADEGRDVFAVPGSVDSALSRGCHSLIRDGAKLVESVADVLDEFAHLVALPVPRVVSCPVANDSDGTAGSLGTLEQSVLDAVGHDPVTLDQLVEYTEMSANRLASTLVALEIEGWVETLPGNRYARTSARRR